MLSFICLVNTFMIEIDTLKNNSHSIPALARIWHEVLGKIWMPEIGVEEIEALYYAELNQDIPATYVAHCKEIPVGSCTLELNGVIRPDLRPWIGDLVVTIEYQRKGIGKMLLDTVIQKAKDLGFKKIYLFTFDPAIPDYYKRFGWEKIGVDEFKSKPVIVMELCL